MSLTSIEWIYGIAFLICLIVAGVSLIGFLALKRDVEAYRSDVKALTDMFRTLHESHLEELKSKKALLDSLDDVLKHTRGVIETDADLNRCVHQLMAETEALHDSIRYGVHHETGRGSDQAGG